MAKRKISNYIFEPGISKDDNLYPNAYALLVANKNYLLAELVAYIEYAIINDIAPYENYLYDSNKCIRDFGYVIDAIAHDLRYGGNVQIRQISEYFWIDGVLQLAPEHVQGELAAFTYTRNLINNFIFNNTAVSPARQSAVSQTFINGSNAESGASTRNTTLWGIIATVINDGPASIPSKINGVSSVRVLDKIDSTDLLLITDTTTGIVLYNFADSANTAQFVYKSGVSSGDGRPLSDLDFPKWHQTTDTITTIYLSADTSELSVSSPVQIFVEDEWQTIRPWTFGTDAIERMRVAAPQAMLDADFEYGLQPTKWQAISTQLGYPSIYEIPGTDTVVTEITTDASATTQFFGASIITVTTVGPHGFTTGTPITIKGLATDITGFSRAEGSFLINSVPTPTTFTYYATAKVGTNEDDSLYTSFVQLRQGAFYTGSGIGTPTFSLVSNGSTGTITTQFTTPAGSSTLAYSGSTPTTGAPLSGSPSLVSGTSITGTIGSTVVNTTVKNNTVLTQTFIDLEDTAGVQDGMAVLSGAGTALFVSSINAGRVNLSGALGLVLTGGDGVDTGLTGTNVESIGTSAVFDVSRSNGVYNVISSQDSSTNGQNYAIGDIIVLAGTDLGGASPANDVLVTITNVASGGEIDSFTVSGTSITGGASYTDVNQLSTTGGGINATIDVDREGGTGAYQNVSISSGGTGYQPGDEVVFSGDNLGGTNPDNNLTIRVDGVAFGTDAIVDFTVISGTGATGDADYTGITGTNLTPPGTGAVFTVTRAAGSYSAIATNGGSGYIVGNRILIDGEDVGGDSPTNDIEISVSEVDESGSITNLSVTGTVKSGDAISIYPTLTLSEPTEATLSSGTVLTTGALATIEVDFTTNHGLVPGSAILTNITSTPAPGFESALRSLPSSGSWSSVAVSEGQWVAIRTSSSNATAVSIDGETWTAGGNLPASANWSSIAGGVVADVRCFVAIRNGSNSAARSIDDGATWSTVTLPTVTNTSWTAITFFDEVFVAVRSASTGAAYSTNGGATWSTGTLPSTANWSDVAAGTIGTVSYFVAIASGGTAAAYSFDNGATWSSATLPASATWSAVAFGASRFVAISSGSANAAISTDGTTWTGATLPASTTWNDIVFGDDVFVAVAQSTDTAITSFTGETDSWTTRTLTSNSAWDGIAYGTYSGLGLFVVVGNNTTANSISLTSANHQLAAGPFIVTSVPTSSTIRFPAKTTGVIDVTEDIEGEVYSRPEAFFVHRPFDGGVQLGTGGPQHGAQAIRQSKKYIRYQSGKGIMYTTGALFAPSYDLLTASASDTAINSVITFSTDDTDHGLQAGGIIEIIGMGNTEYNGTYTVDSIRDSRTFRVRSNNALNTTTPAIGNDAKVIVRQWHGSVVRTGPFDDQNGLFFQYDGRTMALGKRSSTFQLTGTVSVNADSNAVTGVNTRFQDQLKVGDRVVLRGMTHTITAVNSQTSLTFNPDFRGVNNISGAKMCLIEDLIIPQSEWNIDRCDGTGPSGYLFDPGRMQMIGIQYSWYAAGFVEWMIRGSDGKFIFLHRLRNSNVNTEAYMRTANLPVRYEVENVGARGKLRTAMTDQSTSVELVEADDFPNSGILYIDNELIAYTSKNGRILSGLTRSASFTSFAQGSNRAYTAGAAASHSAGVGVRLVSNTITPAISHWGSALLTDGLFDEDRGYLFSYAATSISISTTKTTAFLIRLAPSVSNALTGDLGERDLLNRAQLLLKEISITADSVTGGGGIVVEGVLNPQNYPLNPANIQWGAINTVAAGGQPSFAQIAPGGTVDWASGASQTTRNAQTATGVSVNRRNFLYFKAASWEAAGATIGTEVNSPSNFPAGTRVTNIFGPSNYIGGSAGNEYIVYFSQNSIANISGDTNIGFLFGQPPYALPGETVFSFISNPGERATLDLAELKELTTTALGGRGAFPNGPDVLAINVYKVAGTTTSGNVILRWTEAQA